MAFSDVVRRLSVATLLVGTTGSLTVAGTVSAQDAQPCEPRRALPTADDPSTSSTTFFLTTSRDEPSGVIETIDVTVTRFGPPAGAVGGLVAGALLASGAALLALARRRPHAGGRAEG